MDEEVSNTSDISNKTIVVLVILTVIISILGTVVVLNEVSNMKFQGPATQKTSTSNGQVSFIITESKEPVSSTGLVTFEIK